MDRISTETDPEKEEAFVDEAFEGALEIERAYVKVWAAYHPKSASELRTYTHLHISPSSIR